jgi:two-component system, LytTR family, sensor kinase
LHALFPKFIGTLGIRVKNIALYVLMAFGISAIAQVNMDSVRRVIAVSADTTRIEAYNFLAQVYAQKDLTLSKKYIDTALTVIEKGVKTGKNAEFWEKNKAMSYNILSHINYQQGNFKESIQYCLENVRIFEKYKDTRNVASLYGTIGVILKSIGNTDDALIYIRKNVGLDQKVFSDDPKNERARLDLVASYINLCATFLEAKLNDSCIYYSQRTLTLMDTSQLSEDLGLVYSNMGAAYGNSGNYKAAVNYTQKALQNYIATELPENISMAYSNLAELHLLLKNHSKALEYAGMSEKIGLQNGFMDNLIYLYDIKSRIYAELKDQKNENLYLRKHAQLKDSMQTINHTREVEELRTKYETEKKEAEIIRLNADNEIKALQLDADAATKQRLVIMVITALLVLLILAALSISLSRTIREKNKAYRQLQEQSEQLSSQARLIAKYQSQMNPHFVFNALNSIQGTVIAGDKEKTIDRLQLLSQLMRQTLNNSENEYISLDTEINYLRTYIEFEKQKLNTGLKFELSLPEEPEDILIPPMMIQPFIENSIKHAGLDKFSDACIRLDISIQNNLLKLVISDNGEGFDPKEGDVFKKSHAVSIIRSRLQLLFITEKESSDIQFSMVSKPELERGTQITFYLPLKYRY